MLVANGNQGQHRAKQMDSVAFQTSCDSNIDFQISVAWWLLIEIQFEYCVKPNIQKYSTNTKVL